MKSIGANGTWDRRISRADDLAARFPESADLLRFYSHIAKYQKAIFDQFTARSETDVLALLTYYPDLFQLVARYGPEALRGYSRKDPAPALVALWEGEPVNSEPEKFYARALLQPFAEALASRGTPDLESSAPRCPFCSAAPVAGVLRGEGEGAKRSLLCSICASEWQFRRIVCPNCGTEDKDKLPVYLSDDLDYVRIDACDVCWRYIKSVDLTKNGHAVPVVDELATMALTIWAEENGYLKLETNLLGM